MARLNYSCLHCGHRLRPGSYIRVLDRRGLILTPCTLDRANEEVNCGNARWIDNRTICLVFNNPVDRRRYRNIVYKRDGGICVWCGQSADTLDHIIPASQGGKFHPSNLMCACQSCNGIRGDTAVPNYLSSLTALDSLATAPEIILRMYEQAVTFHRQVMSGIGLSTPNI
ncbi:MAG: HNH endonuclease [Bacilli bacterium]